MPREPDSVINLHWHRLRKEATMLTEHPRDAEDIMLQMRRMLPAEGQLVQRLRALQQTAATIRKQTIARISELLQAYETLTTKMKHKALRELAAQCHDLKFDDKVQQLESAVMANEKRIHELLSRAQNELAAHRFDVVYEVFKAAEKLQKHNTQLFSLMDRTEKKLLEASHAAAKSVQEVIQTGK